MVHAFAIERPAAPPTQAKMRDGASNPGAHLAVLGSRGSGRCTATSMPTLSAHRQFYIQGVTSDGRVFRPSDWAERLAGAMSSFRPDQGGMDAHITYSPFCVPTVLAGVKCVIVSEALRDIEPMAWDFVMSFARDNELPVGEVCVLPETRESP
jgi:hypothetical protein